MSVTDADGIDWPPLETRTSLRNRQQEAAPDKTLRNPKPTRNKPVGAKSAGFAGSLADHVLMLPEVQGLVASAYQDVRLEEHELYGIDPNTEASRDADARLWQEAQARVVRGLLRDLTRYI